jgi:hypothetical protein
MTTSPERSDAAPWYCSHESSRAAASTMVAAGLVAAAALMAFVGLLVAGDEVSALVAATVMVAAGANTWAARRSRTWWRSAPARAVAGAVVPAGPAAPTVRTAAEAPAPRAAPRARVDVSPVPAAAPAPAGGRPPAVVPLLVAPAAAVAREPEARAEAADTVVLERGHPRSRSALQTPVPEVEAGARGDEAPEAPAGSPRPGRAASATAARTRRRTAPVRPVSRRVAGTRSS